jgi:hypothetical protein
MSQKEVSNWEKATVIATVIIALTTIVQSAVIIVSLLLIGYQLRQQVELTKATNSQAAVAQASALDSLFFQNAEVDKLWLKGTQGFEKEIEDKELEQDRYEVMVDTYLTFYENLYIQHRKGLLDDDVYVVWDKDFQSFVKQSHLEKYWDDEKREVYHPDFRKHVDELIYAEHPELRNHIDELIDELIRQNQSVPAR